MPRSSHLLLAMSFIFLSYLGMTASPVARASGGGYYWTHLSNLRLELAEVAKKAKDFLKSKDVRVLSVGRFNVVPRFGSGIKEDKKGEPGFGTGAIVTLLLTEELRRLGLEVTAGAEYQLSGEVCPFEDTATQEVATLITVRLTQGKPGVQVVVEEFASKRLAFGASLVADLFGLSLQYPLALDAKERAERLRTALVSPGYRVEATRVFAAASDQYAVEVVTLRDKQQALLGLKSEHGRATARLQDQVPYAVRLINRSNHGAAVTLSVNGLSNFMLSQARDAATGEPSIGFTYVPPNSSVLITGWYVDGATEYPLLHAVPPSVPGVPPLPAFKVTNLTAFFAAAWTNAKDRPSDDPAVNSRCGSAINGPLVEYDHEGGPPRDTEMEAWERAMRGASPPPQAAAGGRHTGTASDAPHARVILGALLGVDLNRPVDRRSRIIRREIGQNRVAICVRLISPP